MEENDLNIDSQARPTSRPYFSFYNMKKASSGKTNNLAKVRHDSDQSDLSNELKDNSKFTLIRRRDPTVLHNLNNTSKLRKRLPATDKNSSNRTSKKEINSQLASFSNSQKSISPSEGKKRPRRRSLYVNISEQFKQFYNIKKTPRIRRNTHGQPEPRDRLAFRNSKTENLHSVNQATDLFYKRRIPMSQKELKTYRYSEERPEIRYKRRHADRIVRRTHKISHIMKSEILDKLLPTNLHVFNFSKDISSEGSKHEEEENNPKQIVFKKVSSKRVVDSESGSLSNNFKTLLSRNSRKNITPHDFASQQGNRDNQVIVYKNLDKPKKLTQEHYSSSNYHSSRSSISSLPIQTEESEHRRVRSFGMVFDSMSGEEGSDDDFIPRLVSQDPDSFFCQSFNIVKQFILLLSFIYFPLILAFDHGKLSTPVLIVELMVDSIFIFDIYLNCVTGIPQSEKINYNIGKIVGRYVFKSMIFDIFFSMPHSFLISVMHWGGFREEDLLIRYRDFSLCVKLFRFPYMYGWISGNFLRWKSTEDRDIYYNSYFTKRNKKQKKKKEEETFNLSDELYKNFLKRIIILFVIFYLITHIFACFWIFIGNETYKNLGASWINKNDLNDSSESDVYIAAFYFTLLTIFSIGYGDIIAINFYERLFILFFLLFGCLEFAYFISSLSSLYQNLNKKEDFSIQENFIEDLSWEYNLPESLEKRLVDNIYKNEKAIKEKKSMFFNSLPKHIRQELYFEMYGNKLAGMFFLKDQKLDIIRYLVTLVKFNTYKKGDLLILAGDTIEEFIMVSKGILGVELDFRYNFLKIAKIYENYHYGDFLVHSKRFCPYTIKVDSNKAEIFSMHFDQLKQLKYNFPDVFKSMMICSLSLHESIEERASIAQNHFHKYDSYEGFKDEVRKMKINFMKEITLNMLKPNYEGPRAENIADKFTKINRSYLRKYTVKDPQIDRPSLLDGNVKKALNNLISVESLSRRPSRADEEDKKLKKRRSQSSVGKRKPEIKEERKLDISSDMNNSRMETYKIKEEELLTLNENKHERNFTFNSILSPRKSSPTKETRRIKFITPNSITIKSKTKKGVSKKNSSIKTILKSIRPMSSKNFSIAKKFTETSYKQPAKSDVCPKKPCIKVSRFCINNPKDYREDYTKLITGKEKPRKNLTFDLEQGERSSGGLLQKKLMSNEDSSNRNDARTPPVRCPSSSKFIKSALNELRTLNDKLNEIAFRPSVESLNSTNSLQSSRSLGSHKLKPADGATSEIVKKRQTSTIVRFSRFFTPDALPNKPEREPHLINERQDLRTDQLSNLNMVAKDSEVKHASDNLLRQVKRRQKDDSGSIVGFEDLTNLKSLKTFEKKMYKRKQTTKNVAESINNKINSMTMRRKENKTNINLFNINEIVDDNEEDRNDFLLNMIEENIEELKKKIPKERRRARNLSISPRKKIKREK